MSSMSGHGGRSYIDAQSVGWLTPSNHHIAILVLTELANRSHEEHEISVDTLTSTARSMIPVYFVIHALREFTRPQPQRCLSGNNHVDKTVQARDFDCSCVTDVPITSRHQILIVTCTDQLRY